MLDFVGLDCAADTKLDGACPAVGDQIGPYKPIGIVVYGQESKMKGRLGVKQFRFRRHSHLKPLVSLEQINTGVRFSYLIN